MLANALAVQYDATVRFITIVSEAVSDELINATTEYHYELEALCTASPQNDIVRTSNPLAGHVPSATNADVAIVGTVAHSRLHELFVGDPSAEISDRLDCPVLLVHPHQSKGQSLLRRLIEHMVI